MNASYTEFLFQPHPRIPMTEPDFMDRIQLSGELHDMALSEADQRKANLIDAASVMVLRDQEMIDMLCAELKAREDMRS